MLNRQLRTYLESHDVACPACEYNLRGLRKPRCPECGVRLRFGSADDLSEGVDRQLRVEHIEYGMYRQLTAMLSIALLVYACVLVFVASGSQLPTRIALAAGVAVLSGLNMLLRHRYYASTQSKLPYELRHLDRIRDAYGALSMILLMMLMGVIGMTLVGML